MRKDAGKGKGYFRALAAVGYTGQGCLLWPCKDGQYGKFTRFKETVSAHVFVCERARGPAPSPLHEVAHSCGNRRCVAPAHLRWATRSENHHDKLFHGTDSRGEKNPYHKLTTNDVLAIRAACEDDSVLAERYGCNKSNISHVRTRRNWGWL